MRRSAIVVGTILALFAFGVAPANSASRLRLYRGETSDGHHISFSVARTETGRFIRQMSYGATITCEDQTSSEVGFAWGLGNSLPITDRAFSFDVVYPTDATHIAGEIGKLRGSGTMRITYPALTDDEHVQICTTGDLTWDVEIRRIIPRS